MLEVKAEFSHQAQENSTGSWIIIIKKNLRVRNPGDNGMHQEVKIDRNKENGFNYLLWIRSEAWNSFSLIAYFVASIFI